MKRKGKCKCGCGLYLTIEERFWQKVDRSGECWLWTASCYQRGYGQFSPAHKVRAKAHRFSWELTNGKIPNGMYVLHTCDVRACVNPEHLFLGTHEDNMKDMRIKGRSGIKLTALKVKEIRLMFEQGISLTQIGNTFSVSTGHVASIINGEKWGWTLDEKLTNQQ